jgi:hypothetical protein
MTPPRKLQIRALDVTIKHMRTQRCPIGEWPTVKILRAMLEELKREEAEEIRGRGDADE